MISLAAIATCLLTMAAIESLAWTVASAAAWVTWLMEVCSFEQSWHMPDEPCTPLEGGRYDEADHA